MAEQDRFEGQKPGRRSTGQLGGSGALALPPSQAFRAGGGALGGQPWGGGVAPKELLSRDASLLQGLAGELARADKIVAKYGQRMEALRRGCELAGRTIPGGALPGPEPPAAAAALIQHLGRRLPEDEALDRAVRVAVGRFTAARKLMAEAAAAHSQGQVAPSLVEALRRELYFLGRLYESFRHDPMLRQVFPAPKEVGAPGQQGPGAPPPRPKAPAPATERLRAFCGRLDGPVAAATLALAIQGGSASLKGMLFDPQARSARLAALALKDHPERVALLVEVVDLHAQLVAWLKLPEAEPQAGIAQASAMEKAVGLARQDPFLKALFPPLGQESGPLPSAQSRLGLT